MTATRTASPHRAKALGYLRDARVQVLNAGREGLNFATQDYLSLASHPSVHQAAYEALRRYGVHSGGSAALQGRSDISRALEA